MTEKTEAPALAGDDADRSKIVHLVIPPREPRPTPREEVISASIWVAACLAVIGGVVLFEVWRRRQQ